MQDLPAMPRTYAALTSAFGNPDFSMDQVAQIVEQDVAISAKVLQLVNAPLFGVVRHVATIRTAVSYLGINILKNLVLSVEAFRAFEGAEAIEGFSAQALHAHCYLTARIAASLPTEGHLKDAAYVASLLHDVGILVLMTRLSKHLARVLLTVREQQRPMYEVEEELAGVTPAEIGAYLLGLWGLPYAVVESVAYHHNPGRVPHHNFDSLATVYVASMLAHQIEASSASGGFMVSQMADMDYLNALGAADQLTAWREIAQELAAEGA